MTMIRRTNDIIRRTFQQQLKQHQRCTTATATSTTTRSFAYASVSHELEYKKSMEGAHGRQIDLAYVEGSKYEVAAVNPFELYKIVPEEQEQELDASEEAEDSADATNEVDEEDYGDEEEEEEEMEPTKSTHMYNKDGSMRRTRAELASLKAGAPAGGKFAIVVLNGDQAKVTVDDVIITNKLKPVEKWAVGSTHTLNADDEQVLLVGSKEKTLVGLPFVDGAEVDVMVEEITRDKKVIIFKKKRRKNHRRKNGHRREVTFLRVLDIRFPDGEELVDTNAAATSENAETAA